MVVNMRKESFFYPDVPPSTNKIYAGKSHYWRGDEKKKVLKIMLTVKKVKKFDKPVEITFNPVEESRRSFKDCDNYSFGAKMIIDALVKRGVLNDDTRKFVHSVTLVKPEIGKEKGIWVTIEEAPERKPLKYKFKAS